MKKALKSAICIIMLLVLSLSLFACGNSKKNEFIDTFYSDRYNSARNEIVKDLSVTAFDAKLNATGFYSGNLVDGYEDKIKNVLKEDWSDTISNTASKVKAYAETKDISFTYDEAKDVATALVIHLVENYSFYYD